MDIMLSDTMHQTMKKKSPYEPDRERTGRNPVARAGMSVFEMVVWLCIMAVLSLGMLWLLWTTSR